MSMPATPRATLAAAVREVAALRRDLEREHRDHLALADDQVYAGLTRTIEEVDRAAAALDRSGAMAVVDSWRSEAKRLLHQSATEKTT